MTMDKEETIIIEKEPFWLMEAIKCLGWVPALDSDVWLNKRSSWSRERKEEFLIPYRSYLVAMRQQLEPVFAEYPAVTAYLDRPAGGRLPETDEDNGSYEESSFEEIIRWLQDVIEAEETPDCGQIRAAVNRAFSMLLSENGWENADGQEGSVHSLTDVMQALGHWERSDREKLRTVQLYTECEALIEPLRRLSRECTVIGRRCLPYVQERYERYMQQVEPLTNRRELTEKIGLLSWTDPVCCQVYPGIIAYNAIVSKAADDNVPGQPQDQVRVRIWIGLEVFYMLEENRREPYRDEALLYGLKCLSDATRLRIIHLLADRPWYLQELAGELKLTPATVSHHIDLLISEGLVAAQIENGRRKIYYCLIRDKLQELSEGLSMLALSGEERKEKRLEQLRCKKEAQKWTIVE